MTVNGRQMISGIASFVSQESDAVFIVRRYPKIAENVSACMVEFHRRTGIMKKKIWLAKQEDGFLHETEEPISETRKKGKNHWDDA